MFSPCPDTSEVLVSIVYVLMSLGSFFLIQEPRAAYSSLRDMFAIPKGWSAGIFATAFSLALGFLSAGMFSWWINASVYLVSFVVIVLVGLWSDIQWTKLGRIAAVVGYVLYCAVFGAASYKQYHKEHPKSVLVMQAHMDHSYGPKIPTSQVTWDTNNPSEDAVQNVNLTISRASKLRIKNILQSGFNGNDCKPRPVDVFLKEWITFQGKEGDHLTIDSREATQEKIQALGSTQWNLTCSRLSELTSIGFELQVSGDAEDDSIQVTGTYETIASKGNMKVKVDIKVPITK
jgi:hypothetical protein